MCYDYKNRENPQKTKKYEKMRQTMLEVGKSKTN